MVIRSKVAAVGASLILAVAGAAVATPAQASNSIYLTICLSSASTPDNHPITIYSGDYGSQKYYDTKKTVYIGQCKDIYDYDGFARVNIPWNDRYWIGQEGEGYGPCHNGPNYDSNPPSIGANGQYVKYKLSDSNALC